MSGKYAIIRTMRIISGDYGGRPLKTVAGKTTRPTSDKVRGAMFNMIGPYFHGGHVLDLFAGSGGLSIEAVSRGMAQATLVERDRQAQAVIRENIAMTKQASKFQLLPMEAKQALQLLQGPFDLVFLDPPYAEETIVETITELCQKQLLAEEVMVVCEVDKRVSLPEEVADLGIWKEKIYGISKVVVYVR